MLAEQLGEGGDGDVESVRAVVLLDLIELALGRDAPRALELPDDRLGLRINGIVEGVEGLAGLIVEETALLEEERDVDLVSNLVTVQLKCSRARNYPQVAKSYLLSEQLADLSRPRVGDGDDLDQLRILHVLRLRGREERLEADAPVGAQPHERLQGDDGAAPDVRPLRRANVLLVEGGRQVVAQEDGPEYGEWPDVGVEVPREGLEELRGLDLGVLDERHDGGRDVARRRDGSARRERRRGGNSYDAKTEEMGVARCNMK